MAKDITQKVNIEYQAKGIEEIQKMLKTIQPKIGDTDAFKNLKQKTDDFKGVISDENLSNVDLETAKQLYEMFDDLIKSAEKARIESVKSINEVTGLKLESLNKEEEQEEKLLKKQKARQKILAEQVQGKVPIKSTLIEKKSAADKAGQDIGERMISFKGNTLTNGSSFLKNMEKTDQALATVYQKNEKINQKIINREALSKQEIAQLDKIITKGKERGEIDTKFGMTAAELSNQTVLRGKIETAQQKILLSNKQAQLIETNKSIAASKAKIASINLEKEAEDKKQIAEEESSEQEQKNAKESTVMLKTLLELKKDQSVASKDLKQKEQDSQKTVKTVTKAVEKQGSAVGKAAKQVFNYGLVFTALRRIYRETISTITDLDKALTEMSVVTTMNRKESWSLLETFQDLAKQTGFTTTEIAKLSTVYFRQGRSLSAVIELTTVAAKAARVAGISAQESADYITSAVNGFGLAADQALEVSDKFAALAAGSASSYEELATGLSKFAAQANIAGMSIDFSLGLLAKGVETTREAPETIGTALKTVLSRMRELSDLGKTLEDGIDVNRVDSALNQVGISLRNASGQFRDMEDVLTDIGSAWESFNTNQQASIAVSLAGTRQQSRLIAMMNDFDRTLELVNISESSMGATEAQHIEYMKSMEAATTHLQTAWQQLITTLTDSEVIISIVKSLAAVIEGAANGLDALGVSGQTAMFGIIGLAGTLKIYSIYQKMLKADSGALLIIRKLLNISQQVEMAQYSEEASAIIANLGLKGKELYLLNSKKILTDENITAKIQEILLNKTLSEESKKELIQEALSNKLKDKSNKVGLKGNLVKLKGIVLTKLYSLGVLSETAMEAAGIPVTEAATAAQHAHNAALLASPIGLIGMAILGAVAALALYKKGIEDADEGNNTFAADFAETIEPLAKLVVDVFNIVVDLGKVLWNITKVIIKIVAFTSGISGSIEAIKVALQFLRTFIAGIEVAVNLVRLAINWLIESVDSLLSKIPGFNFVKGIAEKVKEGIDKVKDKISDLAESAKEYSNDITNQNLILKKSYDDLAESIEEVNNQRSADNYTLAQESAKIKKLQLEYDELNAKKIKSDEDYEKLATIKEEATEIDENFISGDILLTDDMTQRIEENTAEIKENLLNNAKDIVTLANKDIETFLEDENSVDVLGSLFSNNANSNMDLTNEESSMLATYTDNLVNKFQTELSKANTSKKKESLFTDMQEDYNNFASVIIDMNKGFVDIEENVEGSGNILKDKIAIYNKELAELDGDEAQAIRELFPELDFLVEEFGDKLNDVKYTNLFDQLGLDSDTFNEISENLEGSEKNVEEFLDLVANSQAELESQGMSSSLAFAQAWAEGTQSLSYSIDGLTEDEEKLEIATRKNGMSQAVFSKSILTIANDIDTLQNKIDNINETQDKFLNGELTDTELKDFLDKYSEYLSGDNLNTFLSGGDITEFIRQEKNAIIEEYAQQLKSIQAILAQGDLTDEERETNLYQEQVLQTLINQSNEIKVVTKAQHEYNTTLEQYNKLMDLGIDNQDLYNQLLQNKINLGLQDMQKAQDAIAKTEESLKKDLGENYKDYYDVINGVLVWNYDKIIADGKSVDAKLRTQYQEALDVTDDFYNELKDMTLDHEQDLIDEKVSIYEDYFDKLEQLEKDYERSQSKEDLIKQLQRLEGASDEASRAKAKELRADLIEMQENARADALSDSRDSLIADIKAEYDNLENKWGEIYTNLVGAGTNSGNAMIRALVKGGLLGEEHLIGLTDTDPIKGYSTGGIVDYTGIAQVHGTTSQPEAFLNAKQTEMFQDLIKSINNSNQNITQNAQNITISKIEIKTASLNNEQDFSKAGESLAKSFSEAISRRGLGVNVKR